MERPLTYNAALDAIRRHYEQAGFEIGEKTPGQAVSDEFQIALHEDRFGAIYAFLDELVLLMQYTGYYFLSAIPLGQPKAVTFHRLSVKVRNTLASVRALCGFGLDSNARVQLRHETAILWCRLIFDEQARIEFEAAQSPADTNKYWHRYLAKGKPEKFIGAKVKELSLNWLGCLNDGTLLQHAKETMGVASHTTLGSVIIDTIQDVTDPNEAVVVRCTTDFSHFTLSTALFVSILPFSFVPEVEYGLQTIDMLERGPWHPKNSKAKNWDEYCRIIRLMPISLFFASVEFTNGLNPTRKVST